MEHIILSSVTRQELAQEITRNVILGIKELKLEQSKPKQAEYLTRKEVAALFKVSLVTVSDWSKSGIIKPYKIGSRVRFLKSEILEAAQSLEAQNH